MESVANVVGTPPRDNSKITNLVNKTQKLTLKKSENVKVTLKTPKGTRDRNPQQMKVLEGVFSKIINCFKRHDAVTIETPVFERKEVLTGKYGEDSKLIYDLQDQGGELLSLRYDLTDFDIAGDYGPMLPDAECLRVIYEILSDLCLGEFVIKVNDRRLLDGLFTACGVPAEKFATTCSSVDKLDKTPWSDVERELCEEKGLPEAVVNLIGSYVQLAGDLQLIDRLQSDPRISQQKSAQTALADLRLLLTYCQSLGITDRIRLDLSLARGLDYYTGVIYEAVLVGFTPNSVASTPAVTESLLAQSGDPPPVKNPNKKKQKKSKKGKSAGALADSEDDEQDGNLQNDGYLCVGSVAGGGRYDGLVGMFDASGQCVPCVGVSFGVERLLAISEALVVSAGVSGMVQRATDTEVMVAGTHKGLTAQRLEFCRLLWDAKIKATMSHKNQPKLLDQFQYCELTGIPLAVILGNDELSRGFVKLRHISSRQEQEVSVDQLVAVIKKELEENS